MSGPGRSVFVFGCYMLALGLGLLLVPNLLLGLFGFPPSREVWIRVVGLLVLYLGVYYLYAGRWGHRAFIGLTVPIRLSVLPVFSLFASLNLVSPMLVLLAVPDLCGALWTWRTLVQKPVSPAPGLTP